MKIVKEKDADIGLIANILKSGGLIIFPCETVYGIGCDIQNGAAVNKLSRYKQRPLGKPYAIMSASKKMAEEYVELNETAKNLYTKFLPGPLTIVSRLKHQIQNFNNQINSNSGNKMQVKLANGIASEQGTLGVRIPDYVFMQKLISKFGRPIVATSANASYKKRPYKISDILDNISDKQKGLIDLIIDAGELPHNEPSTVIDTTLDDPVVLRQGEIIFKTQNSILSRNEQETQNAGKELWQKYEKYAGQRAIVFALEGPMGAGKTQMTKGIAKAMGITEEVISPTFNLELQYKIPNPKSQIFSHLDAWRMQNGEELENLGLKGLINDKSVLAIEWADRVADTIRKYNEEAIVVWTRINYGKKESERTISWGII